MFPVPTLKSLNHTIQHLVEKRLWLKVVISLVLGFSIGMLLKQNSSYFSENTLNIIGSWAAFPGVLFLKLVKMIMIPLVVVSIMRGITSNSLDQLKDIGVKVLIYFLGTTVVSITIGIVVSLFIKPGNFSKVSFDSSIKLSQGSSSFSLSNLPSVISDVIPDNPLASMVTGEMLSIVIFSIIIGIAITFLEKQNIKPIIQLISSIQEICMTVVKWSMYLIPYAVFGLMLQLSLTTGISSIASISMYVVTVIFGLLLLLIFYMILISIFGKRNPFTFLSQIKDVQLLAFSTTSSAAVMPLSLKTAEDKLKIKPSISNFVIPIGTTINMDGTAIYQCVSTIFIAQVYGLEIGLANIILVMFTIIAASIGTPAIPGGGVVVLASVLQSIGIPAEGIVMIIGVERILGMFRTALNVTGDLTACVIFDKFSNGK